MVLYLLVHEGLSEGGLILLIVPVSSVADDIDEDVFLELLAIGNSDFHTLVEDIRLVSVDVDYGRIHSLSNLSAVKR